MNLIDREAAIGRIEKKLEEVYGYTKTEYSEGYVNACHAAEKMLNSLPSAQPNTSNMLNALSAKMDETCPDVVIRRQDVVNVIFKEIDSCDKALLYTAPGTNEKEIIELQRAIMYGFFKKIAQLPFAQPEEPERKKGKWIFVESVYKHDGWDSDIYRCNQCHRRTELRVVLKSGEDITDYKRYCEYCGADMRGEQDGN